MTFTFTAMDKNFGQITGSGRRPKDKDIGDLTKDDLEILSIQNSSGGIPLDIINLSKINDVKLLALNYFVLQKKIYE